MIEVEIEHFTDFAAIINRINTVGNSIVQALGTDELIKQIIGDGGTIVDGTAALLKTEAAPIMFAAEALRSETEFVAAFKRGDYLGAAASASVFVTRFTDSALCGYASAPIAATPFAAVAKEVGFLCDQALSKMFDFNITNSIELGSLIGDVTAQEDTKRFNIQLARYIRSRTDFKYSKGNVPRCGAWFMDPDKNSCDLSDLACVPITSTYPCRLGGIRGVVPYDPGKVETAGEAIILQAQQAEENATLLKAAIDRAVAQLIEDLKRERPPVPVIDVRPGTTGTAPFIVFFDGTNSKPGGSVLSALTDPTPSVIRYSWDFGDSSKVDLQPSIAHRYESEGSYLARLTITDSAGRSTYVERRITVLPASQPAQPGEPYSVSPSMSMDSSTISPPGAATLSGKGFTRSGRAFVTWEKINGATQTSPAIPISGSGSFSWILDVPVDFPSGDYTVRAKDESTGKLTSSLGFRIGTQTSPPTVKSISPPSLQTNSGELLAHGPVTLSGSGFHQSAYVSVRLATDGVIGGIPAKAGDEAALLPATSILHQPGSLSFEIALPPGTYDVFAINPDQQRSEPVRLTVTVNSATPKSFTTSTDASSRTITQGQSTTFTLTIQSAGGFSQQVDVFGIGMPTNSISSWSQDHLTPSPNGTISTTLTINGNSSTVTGTFPVILRAASSGYPTKEITVNLTVISSTLSLHPQLSISPTSGTLGTTSFTDMLSEALQTVATMVI